MQHWQRNGQSQKAVDLRKTLQRSEPTIRTKLANKQFHFLPPLFPLNYNSPRTIMIFHVHNCLLGVFSPVNFVTIVSYSSAFCYTPTPPYYTFRYFFPPLVWCVWRSRNYSYCRWYIFLTNLCYPIEIDERKLMSDGVTKCTNRMLFDRKVAIILNLWIKKIGELKCVKI